MLENTQNNENRIPEVAAPLTARERKRILERDRWRCRYCGSQRDLQVDHIFPRSMGGGNQDDNLAVACASCNHEKSNKIGLMPRPVERNRFEGMKHWKRVFVFLLVFRAFWFCLGVAFMSASVLYFWIALHLIAGLPSLPSLGIAYGTVMLMPLGFRVHDRKRKDNGQFPTLELLIEVIGR